VTWKRFARVLVRKSERALTSARRNLTDGDYDSAVNRSYYAMFDIARAAVLRAGVAEDKLPRTHNGVIQVFRQHAVQSGLMDQQLAGELSRTESLRIKADYTDLEIEPKIASEVVEKAELFVQTVERVFTLDESSLATEYEDSNSNHDDKVSETDGVSKIEKTDVRLQPISLEDIRREARENWLRSRQLKIEGEKGVSHGNDNDRDVKDDQSRSLDADFDE
jgi:uncharacterized protein (UPF0332 family)